MNLEAHLEKLKEQGCRTTPLRRALLQVLLRQEEPVSVQALAEALSLEGLNPNASTLYRQLETLVEHGVVQSVVLNPKVQLFEITQEHHHHFVCESCSDVLDVHSEEVESAFHKFERELSKKGLSIQKHELTFFGACQACH